MKVEYYVVHPAQGSVVQIYVRCRPRFLFLHGFGRGAILLNGHIRVIEGFRVRFKHDLTVRWAELHEFPLLSLHQYTLDVVPEESWMTQFYPVRD